MCRSLATSRGFLPAFSSSITLSQSTLLLPAALALIGVAARKLIIVTDATTTARLFDIMFTAPEPPSTFRLMHSNEIT